MKPYPSLQPFLYWLTGLILIGAASACALPAQTPTVEMTVAAILTTTRPTIAVSTPTPIREAPVTSTQPPPQVLTVEVSPTTVRPTVNALTRTPSVETAVTQTPTASVEVVPEVKPTQEPLLTGEYQAPTGLWSAQGWGQFQGETYHAELRVMSHDGQILWTASQDFNAGLGVPLPTPLVWSQDGRYLYYTNVPLVDGYTCSIPVNGSDLWRMDLTDGRVSQLVPEVGLSVSLSPDEKTFAYVSFGQQQNLVLRDLATGEERRLSLPADTRSGGIVWSPDNLVLTLTVAEGPCTGNEVTSTLTVDAVTLALINASS